MSNIRQRKKELIKTRILKSAEETFLSQGYEKATIAEIANRAEIGVGTFYNYFSSKSEVYIHIFLAHMQKYAGSIKSVLDEPGEKVEETVIYFCNLYLDTMQNIEKEFWKDIISVFASDIDKHKNNMSELIEIDFMFMNQMSDLINYYQQKGSLKKSFSAIDVAQSIYGIFAAQFIIYLINDQQSFAEVKDNINRQLKLFFANKF